MPRLSDLNADPNGRIYVVQLDSGEFKVGQTQNVRSRIGSLRAEFRNFLHPPRRIVDGWYSHEHVGYRQNEVRLISFCIERFGAPTSGVEMFRGDFEAAVAFGEEITSPAALGQMPTTVPA